MPLTHRPRAALRRRALLLQVLKGWIPAARAAKAPHLFSLQVLSHKIQNVTKKLNNTSKIFTYLSFIISSGSSSKASVDQISCSSSTEKSSGTSSSSNKSLFGNFSPQRPDKPKSQSPQQSGLTTSNGVASSSLFKHSTASPASSSFIFGQNLQSRVATAPLLPSPPAPSSSGANNGSGEENGPASSDNLFTAAASEFATSRCVLLPGTSLQDHDL